MLQIPLNPGLFGGKRACLRPLCGQDEAFVSGTDSLEAIDFLDRLLVETTGTTVGPGKAGDLTVCDCDRLFAALYLHYFGEEIESTVPCRRCSAPFELSFSLSDMMAHLEDGAGGKARRPDHECIYTLPDGRRFRLPTMCDQQSVIGLEEEEAAAALLRLCMVEGDPGKNPEALRAALDETGAILDVELNATCAECGAAQIVRFDIQSYFLGCLTYEKQFLHHEVHLIAMAYGWGHEEILNLTREDRRAFVRLVEADRAAGGRVSA